jgi:hypothetical protein
MHKPGFYNNKVYKMEAQLDHTNVAPWKFWKPPVSYKIPEPPTGHCYVPLKQGLFSARYEADLSLYPALAGRLSTGAFVGALNSADFVIKTPYFKYLFVKYFLFAVMAFCVLQIDLSITDGDIGGIIIYSIGLILSPFGIRLGGKQYLERMHKYKKAMSKALSIQTTAVLCRSGVVAESGEKCLWIDFHTGSYTPPPASINYLATPEIIYPGTQVNF